MNKLSHFDVIETCKHERRPIGDNNAGVTDMTENNYVRINVPSTPKLSCKTFVSDK